MTDQNTCQKVLLIHILTHIWYDFHVSIT